MYFLSLHISSHGSLKCFLFYPYSLIAIRRYGFVSLEIKAQYVHLFESAHSNNNCSRYFNATAAV